MSDVYFNSLAAVSAQQAANRLYGSSSRKIFATGVVTIVNGPSRWYHTIYCTIHGIVDGDKEGVVLHTILSIVWYHTITTF